MRVSKRVGNLIKKLEKRKPCAIPKNELAFVLNEFRKSPRPSMTCVVNKYIERFRKSSNKGLIEQWWRDRETEWN